MEAMIFKGFKKLLEKLSTEFLEEKSWKYTRGSITI